MGKVKVKVGGTSPLSFMVHTGSTLTVKEVAASSSNRPTVGGSAFKKSGYLIFNGITKIGSLSSASQKKLGDRIPATCRVATVDKQKKILEVEFDVEE